MKKIYLYVVILLCLCIPIGVNAKEGIDKFYADATVNTDGSVLVKEAFTLSGDYNGFDRIIKYANEDALNFNANTDTYGGTSLHNGTGITINKVMGIDHSFFDSKDFSKVTGTNFMPNQLANINGYYHETSINNGKNIRIYNASSTGRAFYVEYLITDLAILHNDIAELGWNIFGEELVESIDEFYMIVHLPNNKKDLKVWAHGPLNGNIKIVDKQAVEVTIDSLSSNTPFDIRLAFDKDVIKNSTKTNNFNVLDKMLKYEQEKANIANNERKQAKLYYYGSISLCILWSIGMIGLFIYVYFKYDKEYKSDFNIKYYREFPNIYGPEIVGYLFNKKIGTDDLSAAIMNLIYKKAIKVEEIMGSKDKDYKFMLTENQENLTESDKKLVEWLFDGTKEIELKSFQDKAKKEYEPFLSAYGSWKKLCMNEAEGYNFYENKNKGGFTILYAILGVILFFILGSKFDIPSITIVAFILGLSFVGYFMLLSKKSIFGNEEYSKWKAFKNFLNDFGDFSEKELPEIVLWEKYLVYAVTLGCAKKLSKSMEIKVKELYPNGYNMPYYNNNFYYYMALNRTITSGVNSAVNTAVSTRTAAMSSSSSGSGGGGGFSSGGGSFGGGGGGGRF